MAEAPAPQYDAIAQKYDRVLADNPISVYCSYPRLYETLGDLSGKSVLDLGTGAGKVIGELSKRFPSAHFVGVDQSEEMLKIARKRSPRVQFICGTVGEIGAFGQFDVIICSWLLHYAKTKLVLATMCRDIMLNLKKDGFYAALNENPNSPTGGAFKYRYFINADHDPPIEGAPIRFRGLGTGEMVEFEHTHWDEATYREAMVLAGLNLDIKIPQPTDDAIYRFGRIWWQYYMLHPTTAIFCGHHMR